MKCLVRALVVSLLFGGLAHAGPPTFALEVRPKDWRTRKAAETLLLRLRELGAKPSAVYRLKGKQKDVVAALVAEDCFIQLVPCAVAVGERVGVDYMITAELEPRGRRIELFVNVISIGTKQRIRAFRDVVPPNIDMRKWARDIYNRAVEKATGELVITTNVKRGSVLVDGVLAAEIYENKASVLGIAAGLHRIEIRASGFKSHVEEVKVEGETRLSVLLDQAP